MFESDIPGFVLAKLKHPVSENVPKHSDVVPFLTL